MNFNEMIEVVSDRGFLVVFSTVVLLFMVKYGNLLYEIIKQKIVTKTTDPIRKKSYSSAIPREAVDPSSDPDIQVSVKRSSSSAISRAKFKCPGKCFQQKKDLSNHYFFSNVTTLPTTDIVQMTCGCPARTALFQSMCTTFCNVWGDMFREFIGNRDANYFEGDNYAFGMRLIQTNVSWHARLLSKWHDTGVPEIAIEVFKKWYSPRWNEILTTTKLVAASDYYFDNYERMAAILSSYDIALHMLVLDMDLLLWSVNGTLDGVVFNGMVIMPTKDLKKLHDIYERTRSGQFIVDDSQKGK